MDIYFNLYLLIAMVGVMQYIKKVDKEKKYKKVYGLLYIIISIVIGALISLHNGFIGIFNVFTVTLINAFVYFGIGSLSYQFIIKNFNGIFEKYIMKSGGSNENTQEGN